MHLQRVRPGRSDRRGSLPHTLALACRWRDCFSDEHYFATLLATQGRDLESDCVGNLVNVDWSRGGAHPRAYTLREVSAAR